MFAHQTHHLLLLPVLHSGKSGCVAQGSHMGEGIGDLGEGGGQCGATGAPDEESELLL